jgi:hypothetical protein
MYQQHQAGIVQDYPSKTFYVAINISSSAYNNRTIKFQIPASGLSFAGTNQSEEITNLNAITIDASDPVSSVDPISGYWKDTSPLIITADATDTVSGIDSVTLYWSYRSDNLSSWGGPVSNGSVSSSPYSWEFAFENGSGHYRFYTTSVDNNSNTESAPLSNDTICGYDVTAPESEADDIAYTQDDSPITINAIANDTHSGVDSVTLYWYNSIDNSTWSGPFSKGADSSSPYSWSFSFDNGTGYYKFYSKATDNAANIESKITNDTSCNFTNELPIADAGGPYTGYINQSITFDGSDSTDPDGTIVGYRWDFDNDSDYDTDWNTSATVIHNYTSKGNYTMVRLIQMLQM